jgi:hypothetical protein
VWNAVHIGEMRNAYIISVENPEGKRSLGIHKRRWEDNIKMDLKSDIVWGCVLDSFGLIWTSGGLL